MTKTNIALTIAKQYVKAEEDWIHAMDKLKEAIDNGDNDDRRHYRAESKAIRAVKTSLKTTIDNLKISEKMWHDAIYSIYLENNS